MERKSQKSKYKGRVRSAPGGVRTTGASEGQVDSSENGEVADVIVSSEGAETGVGAGEFVIDFDDSDGSGAAAATADWI